MFVRQDRYPIRIPLNDMVIPWITVLLEHGVNNNSTGVMIEKWHYTGNLILLFLQMASCMLKRNAALGSCQGTKRPIVLNVFHSLSRS